MKRKLVMILTAAMLVSAFAPAGVSADECEDDWDWTDEEEEYEEEGGYDDSSDPVEEPEVGYYYWQDGSGNIWYHNGDHDEYFGSSEVFSLDPDTGEPMERQTAEEEPEEYPDEGLEKQQTEPTPGSDRPTDYGYYYWTDEAGDVWYHNGDVDDYIGSKDEYYIDPETHKLMKIESDDEQKDDGCSYWLDPCGGVWCTKQGSYIYMGNSSTYYMGEDSKIYATGGNGSPVTVAETEPHTYMSFSVPDDMQLREYTESGNGSYSQYFENNDENLFVMAITSPDGKIDEIDMTTEDYIKELYAPSGDITKEEINVGTYPATRYSYITSGGEVEKKMEAICLATDTDYHCFMVWTEVDSADSLADTMNEILDSLVLKDVIGEDSNTVVTPYFTVAIPDEWAIAPEFSLEETETGYNLTFYGEGEAAVSLEAREITEEEFELDSVWQTEIGYVTDSDAVEYRLLLTISQTVPDAPEALQKMLDTYNKLEILDTIQ